MWHLRSIPAAIAAAVLSLAAPVLGGSPVAALDHTEAAMEAFQRGDWKDAAAAFEKVLEVNPYDGAYWHNYGFAVHQLGRYHDAIAAFGQSMELGYRRVTAMYGSKPNFVGETNLIVLPCTGLRLTCSSLYWQRSHAFDDRTWIAPDLVAETSSADFRSNRDPAMETILAFIGR